MPYVSGVFTRTSGGSASEVNLSQTQLCVLDHARWRKWKFVSSVRDSVTPVGFYVIGIGGFAVGLSVFEKVKPHLFF